MAAVNKQISFDEELVKRMDEFAVNHFMNRSALVTTAVTQFLNQQELTDAIKGMAKAMQVIALQGLDPEVQAEFERWAEALKMLTGADVGTD